MKIEKSTLEICFKYPNAEIIESFPEEDFRYGNIFIYIVNRFRNGLSLADLDEHLEDCKLILRSINSLTEEEVYKFSSLQPDLKQMDRLIQVSPVNQFYYSGVSKIDYLRSINIDIDNLKERGLAIYE